MRKLVIAIVALYASASFAFAAEHTSPDIRENTDKKTVLILCYHQFHVSVPTNASGTFENAYTISVADFKRQMDEIHKEGYTVIPISDYLDYMAGKKDIPDKSVIITIDDGYYSTYKYAYPVLRLYRYPFTVYVYSNWIGSSKLSMSWDNIKEMEKSGLVTVGSHSRSHPYMTKPHFVDSPKYKETLRDEIANSKSIIEKELGHAITTFAYPYGAYNEDTMIEVIKADYQAAVSVKSGVNDNTSNLWALNRVIVRSNTDIAHFVSFLHYTPIDVDYTVLSPYDGQTVDPASMSVRAQILNFSFLKSPVYVYINGIDHTGELDMSKINNGIITGSVTGYKKGYNMITITSHDRVTGHLRQVTWSFFAK